MEVLNMCMFASVVDYDAAVRRKALRQETVAIKQQTEASPNYLNLDVDNNRQCAYNTHFAQEGTND